MPGVATVAAEFLTARRLFLELHQESTWNPWVLEDRAEEVERAMEVMGHWTRAEPDHRMLTDKQVQAMVKRQDRETKERCAAEEERFAKNRELYDPEKESARLALLEQESRLDYEIDEVETLRSGERFPAMDSRKRAEQVAELDASITRRYEEVSRLSGVVGDPEQVVDVHGRLPLDRRSMMLASFTAHRSVGVRALREKLPELTTAVNEAADKGARAKARLDLEQATSRLDELLAIPQLIADDMCSECPRPIARHGWRTPPTEGPCPAWPGWSAKLRDVRQIFETFARNQGGAKEPAPLKPKSKPLAVVPSGLSIAEVIEQLMELQTRYPSSKVRRGRANRWELWPSEPTED